MVKRGKPPEIGAKSEVKEEKEIVAPVGSTPNVIFGAGVGGRPIQDPNGEKRDKKIHVTFTKSEFDKIELAMSKLGAESKSNYLRKIVLENI